MREINTAPWAEIIFENRNKEYGAYPVRLSYQKNLWIALLSTVIAVCLLLSIPGIINLFKSNEDAPIIKSRVTTVQLGAPPAIDKKKLPPPAIKLPPPTKKVVKFVPPTITEKDVTDDMATLDEIKKNQTGTKNTEGTTTQIGGDDGVEGEGEDAVYTFVDQEAEFPGGAVIMARYLAKNMKYPQVARRAGLEGTVHIAFIVGKAGVISDVEIMKGLSPECDAEAMRVVKMMPPWRPARQNGVPVRSRFVLPLRFKLGLVAPQ